MNSRSSNNPHRNEDHDIQQAGRAVVAVKGGYSGLQTQSTESFSDSHEVHGVYQARQAATTGRGDRGVYQGHHTVVPSRGRSSALQPQSAELTQRLPLERSVAQPDVHHRTHPPQSQPHYAGRATHNPDPAQQYLKSGYTNNYYFSNTAGPSNERHTYQHRQTSRGEGKSYQHNTAGPSNEYHAYRHRQPSPSQGEHPQAPVRDDYQPPGVALQRRPTPLQMQEQPEGSTKRQRR
jgi:hypothetical protein